MRIVLTGSEGFIGTAIARLLEERRHTLVRIDLMTDGRRADPGVHQLDVRQATEWAQLLDGADVVCHQAAKVGAAVHPGDAPDYASHNVLGTTALLAAMHLADVRRLVLASSMVVYGDGRYLCDKHDEQSPQPRDRTALTAGQFDPTCPLCGDPLRWSTVAESAALRPHGAYAASKLAQEQFATSWAQMTGSSVIALRYHNVYGPHMPKDTPYCGVAAMFRSSIERGEAPTVFEDGGQVRDFVHVTDVARANVAAIERVADAPLGTSAAYNVCSGQPVTIGEVAQIIGAAATPAREPVVTGQYRPSDVRHVVADPGAAQRELGFTAAITPQVGLRQFVNEPLR